MDLLGRSRKDILAYTMPGFGTSDKTYKNAWRLMKELGYGKGYAYDHNEDEGFSGQDYFP